MLSRVRDIPPGVRFCLVRNGQRFTMISQHEDRRYLFRVIAHPYVSRKGTVFMEKELTLNGQSFAKPVVRCQ